MWINGCEKASPDPHIIKGKSPELSQESPITNPILRKLAILLYWHPMSGESGHLSGEHGHFCSSLPYRIGLCLARMSFIRWVWQNLYRCHKNRHSYSGVTGEKACIFLACHPRSLWNKPSPPPCTSWMCKMRPLGGRFLPDRWFWQNIICKQKLGDHVGYNGDRVKYYRLLDLTWIACQEASEPIHLTSGVIGQDRCLDPRRSPVQKNDHRRQSITHWYMGSRLWR